MIRKAISSFLLLSLCLPAMAQDTCGVLSEAVDMQLKNAALNWARGIGDDSAPRATLRELEISNALSLVRMNLDLMTANKCPARTRPINHMIYMTEAIDCNLQTMKGIKDSPACEMWDWKGFGTSEEKKNGEG